jgi:imidazoleglycerol-phosphate dehydratase
MAEKRSRRTPGRTAKLTRQTRETSIRVELNLDGSGRARVRSGVGFLDHMIETLARHAAVNLVFDGRGDVRVDDHHSVEDAGLVLGQALAQALGNKSGIRRFGFASVPLDEALAQATVDLSGRGYFSLAGRGRLGRGKVGSFDVELAEDFLAAFARAANLTLHVEIRSGRNAHHIIESVVKALARALRQAVEPDERIRDVPSTKGVL